MLAILYSYLTIFNYSLEEKWTKKTLSEISAAITIQNRTFKSLNTARYTITESAIRQCELEIVYMKNTEA